MAGGPRSTAQQYEHLLFGSVTEANLQALLHRLRGLCDSATEGGIEFCDREITYKIGPFTLRKPVTWTVYPSQKQLVSARPESVFASLLMHPTPHGTSL